MKLDDCGSCGGKPVSYEVNGNYYVSCSRCDSGHQRRYKEYEESGKEWKRIQELIRSMES